MKEITNNWKVWLSHKEALTCFMSFSGAWMMCRTIRTRHSSLLFLRNLILGYTPRDPVNQTPNCASLLPPPHFVFLTLPHACTSMISESSTFWGLHWNLNFTFTASSIGLLRPPQRIPHIAPLIAFIQPGHKIPQSPQPCKFVPEN